MTIIYNCKNCNEELEVSLGKPEINSTTKKNSEEHDFDIIDFDCCQCGYENTLLLYVEVE